MNQDDINEIHGGIDYLIRRGMIDIISSDIKASIFIAREYTIRFHGMNPNRLLPEIRKWKIHNRDIFADIIEKHINKKQVVRARNYFFNGFYQFLDHGGGWSRAGGSDLMMPAPTRASINPSSFEAEINIDSDRVQELYQQLMNINPTRRSS